MGEGRVSLRPVLRDLKQGEDPKMGSSLQFLRKPSIAVGMAEEST